MEFWILEASRVQIRTQVVKEIISLYCPPIGSAHNNRELNTVKYSICRRYLIVPNTQERS
jgi:hypothetical protein